MKKEIADKILTGVTETYDGIAESFSSTRGGLWGEMRRFRDFVKDGDRVLDVGCGNGRAYQLFEGMTIGYAGLDVSEGLIAEARRLVTAPGVEFKVGSMLKLPYADASFDAVMAIASFHHVPSVSCRRQALAEMRRVLKPGGILFMTNWNRWKTHWRQILSTGFGSIFGLNRQEFGDVYIPWNAPRAVGGPAVESTSSSQPALRFYHSFRPAELATLCDAAGFEVMEQYYAMRGKDPALYPTTLRNLFKGDNLVTLCRKK